MGFSAVVIEEYTRATVHLGYDNTLGSVDDKCPVTGHQWHIHHINVLFFNIADRTQAGFFINVKDNGFLNPTPIPPGDPVPRFEYQGRVYENTPRAQLLNAAQLFGYTVFGKVVSGMEVVNKIKSVPTGAGGPFPIDVPKTPVLIISASLNK